MNGQLREKAQRLWTPAGDRHGPLRPLLLTLTFVTGLVDATSYLKLGHVFVANMTGNVVFLGFALAGARGLSATASLIALASFLLGALGGGRLAAAHAAHRGHLLRAANGAQAALVALALLTDLLVSQPPAVGVRYALTALLALAMGLQNAAAQRLAVPDLTTTVLTRTLTGLAADYSDYRSGSAPGAQLPLRILAVAAMLLGALTGGLLALHVSVASVLGLTLGLVLCVGLLAHLVSRAGGAWTTGSDGAA